MGIRKNPSEFNETFITCNAVIEKHFFKSIFLTIGQAGRFFLKFCLFCELLFFEFIKVLDPSWQSIVPVSKFPPFGSATL